MSYAPPEQSVRAVLAFCSPQVTLDKMRAVRSLRLQAIYGLVLSDGTELVLVLAPPSMLRLLRSEQCMVQSEAAVVAWARDALSMAGPANLAGPPQPDGGKLACSQRNTMDSSSQEPCHEHSARSSGGLLDRLPTLLRHSPTPKELGSPYNLCSPPPGVPISFLDAPLTSSERHSVDLQVGAIFRQISQLTSPSAKFGPASVVLQVGPALPRRGGGSNTWSAAFHSMLESILRDGEDMAVTLSYPTIRKHFRNHQHLLDYVETPRLVAMDGYQDSNVMVVRDLNRDYHCPEEQRLPEVATATAPGVPGDEGSNAAQGATNRLQGPSDSENDEKQGDKWNEEVIIGKAMSRESRGSISVTGLQDWSKCYFGDPLLASVFDNEPSQAFLQGFSGLAEYAGLSELGLESSMIDDGEHALVRILLYRMYHAIVCIVSEFYRPRSGGSECELAARRRLNRLLLRLGELDVDPKRRHRRPTSDMSPTKKPKPDDDGVVLDGGLEERGGDPSIDRTLAS